MNTIILKAEEVSKSYSNHLALNKINLQIPENSIYGLLGPNGAGKTTFIRMITGILRPDSGKLFYKQQALGNHHFHAIGYLPEERGLYGRMKAGEQLLYLAGLKGLNRKKAKEQVKLWTGQLQINEWLDKNVEELSKGMQQKIQFIAAVIHEPELIILDEPFSGFDPVNAELIKNEILALQKKGHTIILSSHRMDSVESLCKHICLINKSEKVLEGSIDHIKEKYKKNIFEVHTNQGIQEKASFTITSKKTLDSNHHHYCIQKKDTNSSSNKLLTEIMMQAEVLSFREVLPSIHDIFIEKVK